MASYQCTSDFLLILTQCQGLDFLKINIKSITFMRKYYEKI
jgi:hypothetical protein